MRFRPVLLSTLVLALLVAVATAQAQPSAPDVTDTIQQAQDTVGAVVDDVNEQAPAPPSAGRVALDRIGDAFGAVGAALVSAARAVMSGLVAAADVTGRVAAIAAVALAGLSRALATSLTNLASAAGIAIPAMALAALAGLRAIGSTLVAAATVVGSAASSIGAAIAATVQAAWSLVQTLRPARMDPAIFNGIAAGGATVSAGVASWSLLAWLRKLGFIGGALAGVAGFSRIDDDKLLENPVRAQVFRTIQANPGVHPSELARLVGSGWGTIVHHLQKLEKGGLVTTRKVNNQRCYFEQGGKVTRTDMEAASAVRGDTAGQIASFVAAHPMTNQKAVADTMDMSPALVSFHVRKLVNLGALERVRRGKEVLLASSASLRRVMGGESAAPIPAMPAVPGMA